MFLVTLLVTGSLAKPQLATPTTHTLTGMRSLALSPDGSKIAFTYRGDVWVADSSGGKAVPVTSNVEMDDYPVWSPDGKWIAFASDRYGSWDVYAVPVDGGETKRLTTTSNTEIPVSWSPDGKQILMDADYEKGFSGIYGLDVATGRLHEYYQSQFGLDAPTFSHDGKKITYGYKNDFPYTRPRYHGSGANQVWMVNTDGTDRKKVKANEFQHLWTQFSPDDSKFYTVTVSDLTPSSHKVNEQPEVFKDSVERTPNVYELSFNGGTKRVTNFVGDAGTRFLTVSKSGMMAFENGGKVYSMVPGQEPKKVEFTAVIDPKQGTSERLVLTTGADDVTLSPDTKTAIFTVNREIWSVPTTKGKGPNGADATQLTDYAGSDVSPVYSADGKSMFFISDRGGVMSLYKMDLASKKVTSLYAPDHDIDGLKLVPGGKSLSFWLSGTEGGLYTIPTTGGEATRVVKLNWDNNYSFSPDGKYVAYVRPIPGTGFKYWDDGNNIWVVEVATGKAENVTQLNVNDDDPAWSADGKYLYFTSDRNGGGIYALSCSAEEAREPDLDLKYTKPTGEVTVKFDFGHTVDRIRRIVTGPSNGPVISDPEKGDLYFRRGGAVWRADYDGDNSRAVGGTEGARGLELSLDTTKLYFVAGGNPKTVDIRKPNMPVATVEFRAEWIHDLVAERLAAFNECWRVYNQTFYDPYFHRRDWKQIKKNYEPLLDGVATRRGMSTLLNEMIGQLESSHSEVGPARGGASATPYASLGFTIDYSYQGDGVKIKDVPKDTPGWFSKTKLNPGEYVLTVNDKPVAAGQSFFEALEGQSGRDVTLKVNATPVMAGARTVTFRALSTGQYRQIQYNNLIDWRRKYVEEKSGGRLTYVHIAGMGGANLDTFNREMWEYVNGKEGAIIDVRENGGGNIADVLIDELERKRQMVYVPRDLEPMDGPGQAWGGKPTVVMCAETSFSNAEMFPQAMKTVGLADLVGMKTPGYVIYTSGSQLVDGTQIRIPGTGVYRVDGTPLEDTGVEVDYPVDITPEQYFNQQDPQLDKAIEVLMKKLPKK